MQFNRIFTSLLLLGALSSALVQAQDKPQKGKQEKSSIETKTVELPGGVELELVWLEGGEFLMGCIAPPLGAEDAELEALLSSFSKKGKKKKKKKRAPAPEAGSQEKYLGPPVPCHADEKPQHTSKVSGFWMGRFEVTQKQWKAVMGNNPSYFQKCGEDCPVESVGFDEIQKFLANSGLGLRLPTEAEWEYAARANDSEPTRTLYGKSLEDVAWADEEAQGVTHPVGKKKPNAFGLFDMFGNVAERVADVYLQQIYESRTEKVQENPVIASADSLLRVVRGGSWNSDDEDISYANRGLWPDNPNATIGFRVALD